MQGWDRQAPPIAEIDVLWITAGLGCDGDTIAMTAATQPSIEDIVSGGIPWTPKVNLHNPFFAFENGDHGNGHLSGLSGPSDESVKQCRLRRVSPWPARLDRPMNPRRSG